MLPCEFDQSRPENPTNVGNACTNVFGVEVGLERSEEIVDFLDDKLKFGDDGSVEGVSANQGFRLGVDGVPVLGDLSVLGGGSCQGHGGRYKSDFF